VQDGGPYRVKLTRGAMPRILLKCCRGDSIDPLGSGYLQPISELSHSKSASALWSKDMLGALEIYSGGF